MAQIKKNPILYLFLILLPFSAGLALAHLTTQVMSCDSRFTRFADDIFENEAKSNTLNLHYTLADPKSYGIHNYPVTLGELSLPSMADSAAYAEKLYQKLHTYDFEKLSKENQILYDTLDLVLKTESEAADFPLLYEPLSPTLGIQAQLPILLAEYAFRTEQDIKDYLTLINDLFPYFQQILSYEREKSAAGLFMSRATAQGIIEQCQDFIADTATHYLIITFDKKLESCDFLSEKKKVSYQEKNRTALANSCFPAYKLLIDGLQELLDQGTNEFGLYYLPNGQDYYCHLVEGSTGIYDSIETLEQRLYQQLYSDYMQIQRFLTVYPNIAKDASPCSTALPAVHPDTASELSQNGTALSAVHPEEMLRDLQEQMRYDFPSLSTVTYEVKYVDDALKEHLSPAFYLTPPIDTRTPNSIYLNPSDHMTGVSLYTTLAHEGFPGHLYQTQYFAQTQAHPLLSLFASGGYVEGWATYIESYAYGYAPISYEIGQYLARNRSFYLCLYSILDIGIHYRGWKPAQVQKLLAAVGIIDADIQASVYQSLLEDPANYLKYCAGSIYLADIREQQKERLGKDFELINFHKKILETGPVPFPVLEKYVDMKFENK